MNTAAYFSCRLLELKLDTESKHLWVCTGLLLGSFLTNVPATQRPLLSRNRPP